MTFKKIAFQLHLYLGLISGLIVFIVCLTGAIWALKLNGWVGQEKLPESSMTNHSSIIAPSLVIEQAKAEFKNKEPNYIEYSVDAPLTAYLRGGGLNYSMQMDPYTGTVLSVKGTDGSSYDFWDFIGLGHFSLWLPYEIGQPIVGYGTLVFVIVLITGIVLWWPKNKKALKNSLWFNWRKKTKMHRKMYDLHNILGFYAAFILVIICFTGMVWALEWWSQGLYKATSGGREMPEWRMAESDTLSVQTSAKNIYWGIDSLFSELTQASPKAQAFSINIPDTANKASAIMITVFPENKLYYNADRYSFDKYTFKQVHVDHPYQGEYKDKDFADKLRRMNYDIHIGAIGGTAGRLLVFFAAIFGMSLPLTGFYLYIKRITRKKKSNITD
ncbi:MAG: PepSY-associated TM helix domain-containing protein [Dysgonomonas sp.]